MRPIIRVENLSKQYELGIGRANYSTFREKLMGGFNFRREQKREKIWALRNVAFDVAPGEIVGVIGRNGAGKSTLLKVLSQITEPTTGKVDLYGRVRSLLEVGTGFHGELSGRENIFLNGAILGMKRREIDRKFDEIVAFAEVDQFIDTPVKHYSSGMYMRLAFAVAAHMEPEILLVDEVLAVGDAAFQNKCLGKMKDIGRTGRTVIFVSHSMPAVENMCARSIVLKNGSLDFDGETRTGIGRYLSDAIQSNSGEVDLRTHPMRKANCLPLLQSIRMLDASNIPKASFVAGEKVQFEFTFEPVTPLENPEFGVGVDDSSGMRVFSVATYLSNSSLPPLRTPCKVVCSIDELHLAPGRYYLSLSAGSLHHTLIDAIEHAVTFDVEATDFYGNGRSASSDMGRFLVRSTWKVN